MSEAAIKSQARKPRPKYLNLQALLFGIRLPIAGRLLILHRVSGALLFLARVWLLWMLDRNLASEAGFEQVKRYAGLWPVKLALLGLVWAYCHHFCAGIRYLFLNPRSAESPFLLHRRFGRDAGGSPSRNRTDRHDGPPLARYL